MKHSNPAIAAVSVNGSRLTLYETPGMVSDKPTSQDLAVVFDKLATMWLLLLLVITVATVPTWSQAPQTAKPQLRPAEAKEPSLLDSRTAVLKRVLQAHLQQISPVIDEADRFSYAFVDLNGDGKDEAIVYLTGRGWCGTGGCQLYVLKPEGNTYRFVARIPATRPPIRVLDKISHGWHDVSATIREDAARMYEGEFRFNGEKYPLGDTPVVGRVRGRVVIDGKREAPLYP